MSRRGTPDRLVLVGVAGAVPAPAAVSGKRAAVSA